MDYLMKEFNLDLLKADNFFEMALNVYTIKTEEFELLHEAVILTENETEVVKKSHESSFLDKLGEFFKKLIDAVINLCQKAMIKIKEFIEKESIKIKLKDLKIALIKNRQKAGEKVNIFDYRRYTKSYNKYIEECIKSIKNIQNSNYKSAMDVAKVGNAELKRLEKVRISLALNNKEAYYLSTGVATALDFTDQNIADLMINAEKAKKESINALAKAAESCENSFTESSEVIDRSAIAAKKTEYIKKISMSISTETSSYVTKPIGYISSDLSAISSKLK